MKSILLIDHYDSFTYTIKDYFQQLRVKVDILQYDNPALLNIDNIRPTHIVLSPGPGHPSAANQTIQLIQEHYQVYPILGICLGMQCIAYALGGNVIRASEVMHGKQSFIEHTASSLFQDIPSPYKVTRYHSLMVEEQSLPESLSVNAWTVNESNQRILMGIEHQIYPLFGVQYHPEAVLSDYGLRLFENFIAQASLAKHC